jgi:hypothetical protein
VKKSFAKEVAIDLYRSRAGRFGSDYGFFDVVRIVCPLMS